jgi:hypothetical protein
VVLPSLDDHRFLTNPLKSGVGLWWRNVAGASKWVDLPKAKLGAISTLTFSCESRSEGLRAFVIYGNNFSIDIRLHAPVDFCPGQNCIFGRTSRPRTVGPSLKYFQRGHDAKEWKLGQV